MSRSQRENLIKLRQILVRHFSLEEFHMLCFDLGIDYENLPGETMSVKSINLIEYLRRYDRLSDLIEYGKRMRPHADWGEVAESTPERESRLLEQARDHAGVERALNNLRRISRSPNDYDEALTLFERGLVSARRANEKVEAAAALDYVASSYRTQGDLDLAAECYQASVTIWRESGDRSGEAVVLGNIASIYQDQGRIAEARQRFEASLSIIRELGNRVSEAETLQKLGGLLRTTGDLPVALEILEQSEMIWHELGDKPGLFTVANTKGLIHLGLGDVRAAQEEFERALALSRETGDVVDAAKVLTNLGGVAARLADWEEAEKSYGEALKIYEGIRSVPEQVAILANLGGVYMSLRQWEKALESYRRGQIFAERLGDQAASAAALSNIGSVLVEKGDLDGALTVYQQAMRIQEAIGDRAGIASTQDSIGAIYRQREEVQKPLSLLVSEAQRFFQAAGFTLSTTGEADSFICQPATKSWQKKIKCDVYTSIMMGQPLDDESVLKIREIAQSMLGDVNQAFVLVDRVVSDDAWLQIATLRAKDFNLVPIPLTLLDETRASEKPVAERLSLDKHLRRFLGQGYDPYNVRDPVSDVLNFFGREAQARELIDDDLTAGNPVGLFGLRKMGKSSLMRYMQRLMPYPTAWLDLQAGVDLAYLYKRMLRAWHNDAQARFNVDLGWQDTHLDSDDPGAAFFDLVQEALDRLEDQIPEARLAVFLDEIELITPPPDAQRVVLERYLSLMRKLRSLIQEDGRVSLMVAGVDPAVNRRNWWGGEQNPFYQLLQEEYLPPLCREDCVQMIRNIGQQVELSYTEEATAHVAWASGGHPFLARQVCSLAYGQQGQQPGEMSLDAIQKAVERFLFDPQYATFLNHTGLWGEISNVKLWGEEAVRANQAVLTALATAPVPLAESAIVDGPDSVALRSALFALQQLCVIREDLHDQSESRYRITFGLFRSWIRRVQLGLKE